MRFGKHSTTDEVLEGVDLGGRLAVVTGASGGLGAETARALAAHGARVVMTARDMQKGRAAAQRIADELGEAAPAIEVEPLELASLASVRDFAKRFLARHDRLDLLINNAGVMACPFARTEDGFELQIGTNHFGHFVLTNLLVPALTKAAPARVVNLSSGGHAFADADLEDLNYERRDYEPWTAYGQSKTANVLFSVELDRRLREHGVRAYAVHPGAIMTDLSRHLDAEAIAGIHARAPGGRLEMKSIPAGAATSCWAATAAELERAGGVYCEDCHIAQINDDPQTAGGVRSYALSRERALQLWEISESLVGEHFPA